MLVPDDPFWFIDRRAASPVRWDLHGGEPVDSPTFDATVDHPLGLFSMTIDSGVDDDDLEVHVEGWAAAELIERIIDAVLRADGSITDPEPG